MPVRSQSKLVMSRKPPANRRMRIIYKCEFQHSLEVYTQLDATNMVSSSTL